jgi:methylmalonyl-CoA mutase
VVGGRAGQPWTVVARIDAASAEAARRQVELALEGGATGIEIAAAGSLHPLGGHVPEAAIPELLKAIPAGVLARADASPEPAGATFPAALSTRDPIAARALGTAPGDGPAAVADGRPWHAGGASDEQELGVVLATVLEGLRNGAAHVAITLVADADQFRTIAKFRAMRLLLARVAEVAGINPGATIHAETAWRSMSARDPHVNILRATSAAFGAAVGGADSITVLPFDAIGAGDAHGRRLAINTQSILAEEAHLYRVGDAAAGSGAIEAATHALAQAAWTRFQDIESEGGIIAAIDRGGLLRDIAETREARIAQAVAGVTKMVGVNAYAADATAKAAVRNEEKRKLVYRRVAEVFE